MLHPAVSSTINDQMPPARDVVSCQHLGRPRVRTRVQLKGGLLKCSLAVYVALQVTSTAADQRRTACMVGAGQHR